MTNITVSVIGRKIGELREPTEIERKLLEPETWVYEHITKPNPQNEDLSCFRRRRIDMQYEKEKEKLDKVRKWRKELLCELRNDSKMRMDEFCLKARLSEVLDGYIAIQTRLVISLKEENDLHKEGLKDLKWWQDRCYRKIRSWFNGTDN